MDGWVNPLKKWLEKYRFALLILLIGIFLMTFPGKKAAAQPETAVTEPESDRMPTLEERLSELLSQVDGAGRVRVLLTESEGSDYLFQTDVTTSADSTCTETVVISDSGRVENGLLRQVNPPTYRGAVVLCQGAEKPAVRLAVEDAVAKATGLSFDRITVLKMK